MNEGHVYYMLSKTNHNQPMYIETQKHQSPTPLDFCEGKQFVTSGFPSQRASNMEKVSMKLRDYSFMQ